MIIHWILEAQDMRDLSETLKSKLNILIEILESLSMVSINLDITTILISVED